MGIEVPERCRVLRVIACEMSRIISHLVWLGTTGIDLGAFTPFLWSFQQRERIYNLQEQWTGARLTTSLTRVGGMMADVPDGFEAGLREFTQTFPKTLTEVDTMFTRNAIWIGRTQGVGALTAERGDQLLALGADAPGERRRLRRAEGPAVPRLRDLRLRRAGRRVRRHLRPLPGAARGDVAVEPDPRAGARPAGPSQGRADQRRRSARHPAAQVPRDERHGGDDLPFQAGHGRRQAAGRRGLHGDREPQGRAGLLSGLRRHQQAGALADPSAVVHQPRRACPRCARARSCPTSSRSTRASTS